MEQQRNQNAATSTLATLGIATVAAIVVGVAGWLISEFVMDSSRSEAIRVGGVVAFVVIFIGAMVAVVNAMRSDR